EIQLHDSRVRIIELSRNFGHHQAIWTGLQHAQGKLIFLIDSDLEEAPELLRDFFQELSNKQADVVYGVAKQRNGSFFKKMGGQHVFNFFYLLCCIYITQ
ncbi:MAG: glycosyltransferase, partial [Planctomycetia bacterium]